MVVIARAGRSAAQFKVVLVRRLATVERGALGAWLGWLGRDRSTSPADDQCRQQADVVVRVASVVADPPVVEVEIDAHGSWPPVGLVGTAAISSIGQQ